uniref:Uncharacterized protein n=1 Tax=Lates calcarifer TaxID=8187 RepID=A0A4W6DWT3_LATCA
MNLKRKAMVTPRGKTQVNIGAAFQRWKDIRELRGLTSDAEVALFLLDRWVTLVCSC